jgi:group I intron endonuclease
MNIGIYKILNKSNNKVYIGSSIVLNKRKYKHFWMLRKDIHPNIYLQKSYNKNGVEMFEFEIIELCEENDLIFRENHYINYYRSNEMEFGYNLALVGDSRRNIVSAEVKMKLSKHNQNKNGNFSKFSLTNIISEEIFIFDTLIDGANYLIKNGFANGQSKNVRMTISNCLRGVKVNNGHKGSVRKTIYKHLAKVIN